MATAIHLNFQKNPPVLSAYLSGFINQHHGLGEEERLPEVQTNWRNYKINKTHLEKVMDVCGLAPGSEISLFYPFTILFPLHMNILGHKHFPLSPWTMLQKSNRVIQHRQVVMDEQMDVSCRIAYQRKVPKGIELHLHTIFKVADKNIWECMNVYFFPGKFGEDNLVIEKGLAPLPGKTTEFTWQINSKGGFRLARLTGDYNGIHYFASYARKLGFKRDFAHAQRTMAECLKRLPAFSVDQPVRLDMDLKGPVYYQIPVRMKTGEADGGSRFDLYCGDDPRPCICGRLKKVTPGTSLLE